MRWWCTARDAIEQLSMTARPVTRLTQADPAACRAAARCLAGGGLVAFPTETVYGLGADATNAVAIARLYAATRRPWSNPLVAHVRDLASARALARFDDTATRLARAFWPGPLSLVLPKRTRCPVGDLATADLDTIAVRVPDHPIAHGILAAFGRPIVAISASRFGNVAPTRAAHVLAELRGRIDLIVNGGPTPVGLESTIVACLGAPALLRPGGVPRDAIESALGGANTAASTMPSRHSGEEPSPADLFASHAAPKTSLRLDAGAVHAGEALLAFGPPPASADRAATVLNLSPQGDLGEAAANLFSHLRALDATAPGAIAVMPIPHQGLGEAINDRLARAAARRHV
jgi:L-threonylcarbamoyladenylate synthase